MSLRSKQEERKKAFKKGVDSEESRTKRVENVVEIRKNKRLDQQMKRRKDVENAQQQQLVPTTPTRTIDASLQQKVLPV